MSSVVEARLRSARVARLATCDAAGRPHLVPVCFAYDGQAFYTAVDRKPKRAPVDKLARVRNIRANPAVALLVDEYSDEWGRLWYILIRGRAVVLRKGKERAAALRLLREKYEQYRSRELLPEGAPVIQIAPEQVLYWSASSWEETK